MKRHLPFALTTVIRTRLILGLLALLISSSSSYAQRSPSEPKKPIKNQFVYEDVFLSITNGSSFAEVKKVLGSAVHHQFTISQRGHTWMLISCYLHTGNEEAYDFYQLLFRDDVLLKTIGNVPWDKSDAEKDP